MANDDTQQRSEQEVQDTAIAISGPRCSPLQQFGIIELPTRA